MKNFIKILFILTLIIYFKNGTELQFQNNYTYRISDFGKTCHIHNSDYSNEVSIPMENILFISYSKS